MNHLVSADASVVPASVNLENDIILGIDQYPLLNTKLRTYCIMDDIHRYSSCTTFIE